MLSLRFRMCFAFSRENNDKCTFPCITSLPFSFSFQLFDFIAENINNYLSSHNLLKNKLHVAVVFPFAFDQGEDLSKARLTKWSKGFHCGDAIGKDVGEMLMQALRKKSRECKVLC